MRSVPGRSSSCRPSWTIGSTTSKRTWPSSFSSLPPRGPVLGQRPSLSNGKAVPCVGVEVIPTYGLTHIALAVRDPDKSFRFYEQVFGVQAVYREPGMIQVQTPGCHDVIVFERKRSHVGEMKGVSHFGFRLRDAKDIDAAVESVRRAGGKIVDTGQFVPGEPYVFATDPDGYTIEIWYEPDT
ncbi:MAG: VOC family protein [Methanobacteriota archaeon]|nr:MAG: VOC family protein [Euryarchaeota archaeon]